SANFLAPCPDSRSAVSQAPVVIAFCPEVASWAVAPLMSVPPSATGPMRSLGALGSGRSWPGSRAQRMASLLISSIQVDALLQSTAAYGPFLYSAELESTSASTGRKRSWAVVPTALSTSSGFFTSGIDTTMLPPSRLTSDSATPLEFTRLRMMSMVVLRWSWVGARPWGLGGWKGRRVPPVRSRPRRGLMSWTRITPQMPPTRASTTSSGTTSRRVPVIGPGSPCPAVHVRPALGRWLPGGMAGRRVRFEVLPVVRAAPPDRLGPAAGRCASREALADLAASTVPQVLQQGAA